MYSLSSILSWVQFLWSSKLLAKGKVGRAAGVDSAQMGLESPPAPNGQHDRIELTTFLG